MKVFAFLFAGGLLGCASTSPDAPFRDTAALVRDRSGQRIHWDQDTADDAEAARSLHALLSRELSLDTAVQVALVKNQQLQATYENLRIAQADLVQAGLLKNPVFSGGLDVPVAGKDVRPGVSLSVSEDFLSIFSIAARKRIARAELEATEARVGDAVLRVTFDVQRTFFELQSAIQVAAMRRTILIAGDSVVDLARRQHDAGNINDLDLANEETLNEQLRTDLIRSDANVVTAHEELTRLLGVWGPDAAFRVPEKLAELPATEVALDHLEARAISRRLDLLAADREAQMISQELAAAKNFRFFGAASVGASYQRAPERYTTVGPTGSLELPLFDQKQAEISRLEGEMRGALARESALAVSIRSEVRDARNRLMATRSIVERYARAVIPLRQRQLSLSEQQYNAMLLGSYQLIQAKQNEVTAYREFIEELRDYWVARAELQRATGGSLEPATMEMKTSRGEK